MLEILRAANVEFCIWHFGQHFQMKFFSMLFLFLLAFLGCKNHTKQPVIPTFSGIWVHYKYPLYLRDMHSTRIVQDAVEITAISFDPNDTTKAWLTFHAHEVRLFKMIFLEGRNWRLKGTEDDTTVIPLEIAATGKAVYVGREMFHPASFNNFQLIANQFYAGKYFLNGQMILLSENGDITGFGSFVRFAPRIDYTDDDGNGDQIELIDKNGISTRFGVECDGWSFLKIYELRCLEQKNGECIANGFGKVKYELMKEIEPMSLD